MLPPLEGRWPPCNPPAHLVFWFYSLSVPPPPWKDDRVSNLLQGSGGMFGTFIMGSFPNGIHASLEEVGSGRLGKGVPSPPHPHPHLPTAPCPEQVHVFRLAAQPLRISGILFKALLGLTQLLSSNRVSKQQLADLAFQALYPLLIHNLLVKEAKAFQATEVRQKSSFLWTQILSCHSTYKMVYGHGAHRSDS